MSTVLLKESPLAGVYGNHDVTLTKIFGWQMAETFGPRETERSALSSSSILADWSHIGKHSVRGAGAQRYLGGLFPSAKKVAPLNTAGIEGGAVLRLTDDEFLLLTFPDKKLTLEDGNKVTCIDQTGAMGALALGGPKRDEVWERSTAMDLRRDRFGVGDVIQTSVHTVAVTLYRMEEYDLMISPRELTQSLFDALIDVGTTVGLKPAGIATLPVTFGTRASC